MVVSLIAIICGILALIIDTFLLVSGAIAQQEAMNNGPISEYTQLAIHSLWGIVLVIAFPHLFYTVRDK
jgi:hypothetical protein